jgi:hypothetical protein
MHTTRITRVSAVALTLVGAGLAVTSMTAPAQADDFLAQAECGSVGGTYQAQTDHHSQQTLSWSCTYSLPGIIPISIDLPPEPLQSACSGTSSFVSSPGVDVFRCVL